MTRTFTLFLLIAILFSACSIQDIPPQLAYVPLSHDWPNEISQWEDLINEAAQKHDLPADYVAAIILVESGGQENAKTAFDSFGLMQVYLPAAELFASENNRPTPTETDLLMGQYNLDMGTAILTSFLTDHSQKSLENAIKAYGPTQDRDRYLDLVISVYEKHGQ